MKTFTSNILHLTLLAVLILLPLPSIASEETDIQECIQNFNIDILDKRNIDLKDSEVLLTEYWSCRAAAENTPNLCKKLCDPTKIGMCNYGLLIYLEVLTNIVSLRQVSFRDIRNFINADSYVLENFNPKDYDNRKVEKFLTAIAQKDPTLCNTGTFSADLCMAQTKRDENLCTNDFCKYSIYFLQSLETNQTSYCSRIKQKELRGICTGAIAGNVTVCEQLPGYNEFKKFYCKNLVERNKKEDAELAAR